MPTPTRRALLGAASLAAMSSFVSHRAFAQGTGVLVRLPILVPLTGFAALEGKSQRDGALLAIADLEQAGGQVRFAPAVIDTGASPEGAVTAWERAMRVGGTPGGPQPVAVLGPILGTQMLALLPLAAEAKLPIATVSGTARLSEMGNPWFFRFFPSDSTVKVAHARYAIEKLGATKPAIVFQTTAYGQSGREQLSKLFHERGIKPVLEEAVAPTTNDFAPVIARVRAAGADVLVLHLHAPSTALSIRQARAQLPGLPIVAGSAMLQPATAALLEPGELRGVCAESASSPLSASDGALRAFTDAYTKRFETAPDAFAVAQYDAVMSLAAAVASVLAEGGAGRLSGETLRAKLTSSGHAGLAMPYRSDGKGNMAHDALIACYDGAGRVPKIVERYRVAP